MTRAGDGFGARAGTLACVALVRLGLWLLPFGMLLRLLGAGRPRSGAPKPLSQGDWGKDGAAEAEAVFRRVARAARWVPRATCLTQALAAQALLRRRGIQVKLCFGVNKDSSTFRAHAWLELHGGGRLGAEDGPAYTPMEQPIPNL